MPDADEHGCVGRCPDHVGLKSAVSTSAVEEPRPCLLRGLISLAFWTEPDRRLDVTVEQGDSGCGDSRRDGVEASRGREATMFYVINLIAKERVARLEPWGDDVDSAETYGRSTVDRGSAQSAEIRDEDGNLV